jgi:DNA-directed RNA polymerase specialized sigma24 family protein
MDVNELITRYANGDKSVGNLIVDNVKDRMKKLVSTYHIRTKVDASELESAAYYGLALGLNEVDPTIGSPVEYICRRAQWAVLDVITLSKTRSKNFSMFPLSIEDIEVKGSSERDNNSGNNDSSLWLAFMRKYGDRLSSTDQYPALNELHGITLHSKEEEVIKAYLIKGSCKEAGKELGISKQAVHWRLQRIVKRLKEEQNGVLPSLCRD